MKCTIPNFEERTNSVFYRIWSWMTRSTSGGILYVFSKQDIQIDKIGGDVLCYEDRMIHILPS